MIDASSLLQANIKSYSKFADRNYKKDIPKFQLKSTNFHIKIDKTVCFRPKM